MKWNWQNQSELKKMCVFTPTQSFTSAEKNRHFHTFANGLCAPQQVHTEDSMLSWRKCS